MKKLDLKSLLKADQEPEYALSKASGFAGAPKDFDFVAKNIPCQAACPAGTDVPAYLEAIAAGEYAKAYRINLRDNVFPAVLGRVCTRPCEPACRHGWEGLGEPVAICFAKRSADDFMQGEDVVLDPLAETTGKTVAVVGAGAAGLTVARQLQLMGHAVTVFERAAEAGGLMRQGIPEFRLPREVVEREIRQIEKTGVDIRCGESVGESIFLRELHETYDAVIVSSGNWKPKLPALPGNDLQHIRHGLDFLQEINNGAAPEIGDRVVVIGGGFTAVDCVRMAKRLGAADVQLVYRRGPDEMYIGESELDEMKAEGIGLQFNVQPTAFLGDGAVAGVQCVRTETNDRSSLETMAGSDFEISTDLVLLGTGQGRETDWLEESMQEAIFRALEAQETKPVPLVAKWKTEIDGLYLVGDFANGAESLVDAVGDGKACAEVVDEFLMGRKRHIDTVLIEDVKQTVTGRTREMDAIPREPMPELPLDQRALRHEVELGLDEAAAKREAERCYLCQYKFEIDNELCIYCDRCLNVMPVDNCIVRISELTHDSKDRITGYQPSTGARDYNHLYLDQNECIRCGACVEVCPVDCISLQRVSRCKVLQ